MLIIDPAVASRDILEGDCVSYTIEATIIDAVAGRRELHGARCARYLSRTRYRHPVTALCCL